MCRRVRMRRSRAAVSGIDGAALVSLSGHRVGSWTRRTGGAREALPRIRGAARAIGSQRPSPPRSAGTSRFGTGSRSVWLHAAPRGLSPIFLLAVTRGHLTLSGLRVTCATSRGA